MITNARVMTCDRRGRARHDRSRRDRDRSGSRRVGRARARCRRVRASPRDRCEGRAGHAGAGRLPHARGLRGRSRERVRAARGGQERITRSRRRAAGSTRRSGRRARRSRTARSSDLLVARLGAMLAGGTTTIEIKTGYDLTTEGELGLLDTIARAATRVPTRSCRRCSRTSCRRSAARIATRSCARSASSGSRARRATRAARRAVDVYCDDGAFTLAETRAILAAATAANLAVRGHVGQFSDLGGAELFAELARARPITSSTSATPRSPRSRAPAPSR